RASSSCFFFFPAEAGIRDFHVTGVQTCALPICVPLAEVAEKPVPQNGAVPEERLSPTQPYSVGMPTIGAMRLDETKMWGMTLFDQLICRIQFRQLRYDRDFTSIGLHRANHSSQAIWSLC